MQLTDISRFFLMRTWATEGNIFGNSELQPAVINVNVLIRLDKWSFFPDAYNNSSCRRKNISYWIHTKNMHKIISVSNSVSAHSQPQKPLTFIDEVSDIGTPVSIKTLLRICHHAFTIIVENLGNPKKNIPRLDDDQIIFAETVVPPKRLTDLSILQNTVPSSLA